MELTVLEAGCGSGRIGLRMAELGARVIGLDISREAIDPRWLREKLGLDENDFILGDVMKLVLNSGVIEHFERPDEVLRKMVRVTNPGARL